MKRARYVYEHGCPIGLCSRIGERVTVYPHCSNGVAYLTRVVCLESGCELMLIVQETEDA